MSRWSDIERVYAEVSSAAPGDRPALLDELAAGDQALRKTVAEMLAADTNEPRMLERSLIGSDQADRCGEAVGDYVLSRVLGRGGSGTVYLALRNDGKFEQQVAVKLFDVGGQQRRLMRTIARERDVLSRLQHPSITAILDVGVRDDGVGYLITEYVDGLPITEYADKESLDLRGRVALVIDLARAVAYAHQQMIIHRDLKPGNVLVDRLGNVKLLDFGIAKLLDDNPSATATRTRAYTPQYASPEQVLGQPISAATDVYALGVVTCELITGCRPLADSESHLVEWVRRFDRGEDPPSPSSVTDSDLPKDLDLIVSKAIRTRPEQRYSSPAAMADDLARFLASEPILARPYTWRYALGRFIARNRLAVGLGVVTGLALLAMSAISVHWAIEARERQAEAQRAVEYLLSTMDVRSQFQGRSVALSDVLKHAMETAGDNFSESSRTYGDVMHGLANAMYAQGDSQSARVGFEKAFHARRAALGPADPDTLRSQSRWAYFMLREDQEHALRLAQDAYRHGQTLDRTDPMRSWVSLTLATVLHQAGDLAGDLDGDLAESERLFAEAATLIDQRSEHDCDGDSMAFNNYWFLLHRQQRYDEALPLIQRAQEFCSESGDKVALLVLSRNLATAYAAVDDRENALSAYEASSKIARAFLDPASTRYRSTLLLHGRYLIETDQPAAALALSEELLALGDSAESSLNAPDFEILAARALLAMEQDEEATAMLTGVLGRPDLKPELRERASELLAAGR